MSSSSLCSSLLSGANGALKSNDASTVKAQTTNTLSGYQGYLKYRKFHRKFSLASVSSSKHYFLSSTSFFIVKLAFIILLLLNQCNNHMVLGIRIDKTAYHDIVIDIKNSISSHNCSRILNDLKTSFSAASKDLFAALDGRAYFGTIIINLPSTWPDECVPRSSLNNILSNNNNGTIKNDGLITILPSTGEKSDITITDTNRLFGDRIWTQQSSGCEEPGDQIYLPHA